MRYRIKLIPQGIIPRDPKLTFRVERAPAAAAPVAAVVVVPVDPLPYLDAFNGTGLLDNHTADSGHTYASGGTDLIVTGGALRVSGSGIFGFAAIKPPPLAVADRFIEAVIVSDDWATYENNSIVLYVRDSQIIIGTYYARVMPPSTVRGPYYTYTVGKNISSVETEFVTDAPITSLVAENAPVTVRFSAVGNVLTLTIAGVDEFTTTDSDVADGGYLYISVGTDAAAGAADHIGILTAEGDAL